jgi:UDP-glucuronate 4-epimerase
MTILVTGAAGFIGYHLCRALLARGEAVLGIDNLNDYYDVRLKKARLALLEGQAGFQFRRADVADPAALKAALPDPAALRGILHMAAQAGVRYSLIDPYAYSHTNVTGQIALFELCHSLPNLKHLVYASSSSVYGGNQKMPFSESDPVNDPVSLYAATKRAGELIAHVYARLYRLPVTGLRFFTVYGPWGRPDMAAYLFTEAIFAGQPIRLFNEGDMRRDFTFVDDVVAGVLRVLDGPPRDDGTAAPARLYNIGNNRPEQLRHFLAVLEAAIGKRAIIESAPMQPGDVRETAADISALQRDFGFAPKTRIEEGIPRFVEWYRTYHKL